MVVSYSYQKNSAIHLLTLRDSADQLADYTSLGYRFITNIAGFNGYVNSRFVSRFSDEGGTLDYFTVVSIQASMSKSTSILYYPMADIIWEVHLITNLISSII